LTAVHQFIPSLAARDAIGAHTLQVQRLLREMGYASDLYVGSTDLEGRDDVHPFQSLADQRARDRTFLLYQGSTGSPMARFLAARPEPKLLNYHNITPAEFFEPWEPTVTMVLEAGHRQFEELSECTELAIAVSGFNEDDLRRMGYAATTVAPILLDPRDLDHVPDPATDARLGAARSAGGIDWLFVGRICPNKAQHDLIKAFAAYRVAFDPRARLHLVGGSSSHLYETCLHAFAHELGCGDAVEFAGSVTPEQLAAHFRNADVFVCLSRHEGFCVPLLEAMHHRVPVVALRETAVPETLGRAGLLLPTAAPALVAAAVDRVAADAGLRAALQDAGTARLAAFDLERTRERFAAAIRDVCGAP
jgi:glycosyltransferase involved in cell wall biosynthesis